MKSPDSVFRELAKLCDFCREVAKFRLKKERKVAKGMRGDALTSRR
jgi:hypothetical protein